MEFEKCAIMSYFADMVTYFLAFKAVKISVGQQLAVVAHKIGVGESVERKGGSETTEKILYWILRM